MMGISLGHLIILLVIVLLFGGKRLPELGGALGRGLRSFKEGLDGKLDDKGEKQKLDGPKPDQAKKDAGSDESHS